MPVTVRNIHERIVDQPKSKILELFSTLATSNDAIWPMEKWPAMRFKNGLAPGSVGGHGPIRYEVQQYDPLGMAQFKFLKPQGFEGIHRLEIIDTGHQQTQLVHTIEMRTQGLGMLAWFFAIRSLHDALIEDAFDKVENRFTPNKKRTNWSLWVRVLRWVLR